MKTVSKTILKSTALLSESLLSDLELPQGSEFSFPNSSNIKELIKLVKCALFPAYFSQAKIYTDLHNNQIAICLEKIFTILRSEISNLRVTFPKECEKFEGKTSDELSLNFIESLPVIRDYLYSDVKAVLEGDPAAKSYAEVIICYPGIEAILHYRVAHELLKSGIPLIPRIITESAHSSTGIDIHPGATIGKSFGIDHGTGVVIGETCIIGCNVRLYQGVTLGAKSFTLDEKGFPVNVPRHPVLEDNVIVYSNSTILGRVTIGHDSVIGGNIWLTHSVPPHSKILQRKALSSFSGGLGI
jgi:serine O-acetyltransferase